MGDKKWTVRLWLTAQAYNNEFASYTQQGYQLKHYTAHNNAKGQPRFIAIWGTPDGVSRYRLLSMTAASSPITHQKYKQPGYRLIELRGYFFNGEPELEGIWEQTAGPEHAVFPQLTVPEFEMQRKTERQGNYYLADMSPYETKAGIRIAAMRTHFASNEPPWLSELELSSTIYSSDFYNLKYSAYRPRIVCGDPNAGKTSDAYLFQHKYLSRSDLLFIASTATSLMNKWSLPGFSIAITKDERLVFAKSFGLDNKATKATVNPNSVFRIASVSKPITAIATMDSVRRGDLHLNDYVFSNPCKPGPCNPSILGSEYDTPPYSDHFTNITLPHLLEHQSGFSDLWAFGDPVTWTENDPTYDNPMKNQPRTS